VINNQEAKILIGTKEVYVSQTTSQSGAGPQVTADQVNFVDVGIKLYVTPSINSDDFITMKIRPEISSVSSFYEYGTPVRKIPIVATSEAETTVTIKDGVTLIIGGLRRDNKADNVSKIPLIGDIPLIGHLFRRTSHDLQKTELVILLTPHIITGETPYTDLSEPNPKEGARARMTRRKIVKDKFSSSKQDIALNPQEKGAADYYQSLINKINRFARLSKPKGKKGEVALNFKLYPSGELAGQPVVVNTTNPYLNVFAINAIKDASPFGTLPQELQRPGGTFKVSLSYE